MDDDYNRYDSFHPTMRHPRMSAEEWSGAYKRAWKEFYSVDGMKSILDRSNADTYWGLFKNFMWYKYAALVENTHPMICGFLRKKGRRQRRPGMAREPFFAYYQRRLREALRWGRDVGKLYFELQELWLATRGRARLQQNVEQVRRRYEEMLEQLDTSAARAKIQENVEGMKRRYEEMREQLEGSRARASEKIDRMMSRMPLVGIRTGTREHINAYWYQTWEKLRRGSLLRINPFKLSFYFLRDVKLCFWFNLTFLLAYTR